MAVPYYDAKRSCSMAVNHQLHGQSCDKVVDTLLVLPIEIAIYISHSNGGVDKASAKVVNNHCVHDCFTYSGNT